MTENVTPQIPSHPKLRLVEPRWVDHQNQRYLYLHDPMGLSQNPILVPQQLAPVLALCDGERDIAGIRSAVLLRTGMPLTPEHITELVQELDKAYLIENGQYQVELASRLTKYREARYRPASHAGGVYPPGANDLTKAFHEYSKTVSKDLEPLPESANIIGMLCPHIDYARGHATYAQLFHRAAPAIQDVELAIILGTDHYGGLGSITPTRQSYRTPHGVLETDTEIVDGLANVLGEDVAFDEEIHHTSEHSIELASVWFHHFIGGRDCKMVPILLGSFHHFVVGESDPKDDEQLSSAIQYLKDATAGRKTLVIAAGDLAHVGPAFGDSEALDDDAKRLLASRDEKSIDDILAGDADGFFQRSKEEGDSRKICGLSPIYMMLKQIGATSGEFLGYDQCPADADNGSVVSIAGALLFGD